MDQINYLDLSDLLHLVAVAEKANRPIKIDWVNRTIRVVSEVKTNSKGFDYQDIIYELPLCEG